MNYEKIIIGAILLYGFALTVAFAVKYWRRPWAKTPAGRQMMAVSVITAIELASLVLLLLGLALPWWCYAIAYGFGDAVITQRFVLLLRAERVEDEVG